MSGPRFIDEASYVPDIMKGWTPAKLIPPGSSGQWITVSPRTARCACGGWIAEGTVVNGQTARADRWCSSCGDGSSASMDRQNSV